MAEPQRFRANVGIVVLNGKWEVLALDRIDKDALKKGEKKGTGQWQMPQGGLDEGEEPENAWKRELMEEIHVSAEDVLLLGSYPEWLAYELPKEDARCQILPLGRVPRAGPFAFAFPCDGNQHRRATAIGGTLDLLQGSVLGDLPAH